MSHPIPWSKDPLRNYYAKKVHYYEKRIATEQRHLAHYQELLCRLTPSSEPDSNSSAASPAASSAKAQPENKCASKSE